MGYLIGLDIGTSGTKAILLSEKGQIVASSHAEYGVDQPKPLWAQQDGEIWLDATCKVLRDLLFVGRVPLADIVGMAISGLYGGSGIPVDSQMNPLAPCLIWMDRRASRQVEWVKEHVHLERLYEITGNTVDSYYGFTKMMWVRDNWSDVWQKTAVFLPPNAWVIYKLTGEVAIDYSSAGNIGGIFDLGKRGWSDEMCSILGVPVSKQPERLVASSDIVGKLSPEGAALTGLLAGTPVVAGGIDAAVATLSAGAFEEGNHVAMVGTSMCWGFITEKANLTDRLISYPHVLDPLKKNYTFGGAATAGAVIQWFRNNFGTLELETQNRLGVSAYSLLELQSQDVPAGSDGLVFLPYMMGERSPIWDSSARGTLMGLSLYHGKGHIYRACMEGVAYALRHNMESILGTSVKLDPEMVLVGGAAKSSLWTSIFADVSGYPVKVLQEDVEAPLGDALLAGLGTGVFDRPEILKEWLHFKEPVYPVTEHTEVYNELYSEYKAVYLGLRDSMKRLYSEGREE